MHINFFDKYMDFSARVLYYFLMKNEPVLFFNTSVKKIIESFSYCFNLRITFFSLQMKEWLVGYHQESSDYCNLIQKKLKIRYRCLREDSMMCHKCKVLNQSLHYQCHGGLTEVIIPIEIDNTLVAFAMIGQFRLKENPPENIVKSYIEQGFSAEELVNAYKDRPLFTQEKLNKMINIFSTTISLMVNSGEMKIKKATLVEQVLNYVDEHIKEVITINEVSENLKISPSSITHTLTRELGMPFKQLVITRKIMLFENIVNDNPSITIKKASSLIGFEDPLYFSRLYKKKIGITPSEFVNTARQTKLSQNEIIPKLHTFAEKSKTNKF